MKNDTRIQSVVSNTQPKEPGFQGGLAGLFRRPSDNNFSFPFLKTMKVLATFSYLYYDRTIEFTKNPIKIGPSDQLLIYHAIKHESNRQTHEKIQG